MSRLHFTPAADRDLAAIYIYSYARFGQAQADRYVTEIVRRCEAVASGRLPSRDASRYRKGLRSHRTGSHIVFHLDSGRGELLVVRILHSRMRLDDHL
ncbi:type II toxin-antitoxin system RelE/ParE family toxin [Jiella endophytica]|uniref:Type II toxin-antitoxin system RelE/ParE family toxin n=1 Tax=Jiella endophytica TaxID=2558362 RepID=A0A4Y8RBN1_9HYPH|nr:type II toxin-antitoxin system RelE/ParE family toxin [Jiella endophytica]TFF19169.1 type II toxin-antitoxin system RelE/ParE family toxin [Jiella endophytica]